MRYAISPKKLAALMIDEATGGDTVDDAVREGRCLRPSMGCGKPIPLAKDDQGRRQPGYSFPNEAYKAEWKITGLCAPCQDQVELMGEQQNSETD